ncbi:hypothetical protein V2J09_014288 [Rumex salicifolius]
MGCGESKHAVATTEPVKKSTSRSNSRRTDDPTTTTTTVENVNENETKDENGEITVGVIPGKPFMYQKPAVEATTTNETKKKRLVVVVGHDRTASKESQAKQGKIEEMKQEQEQQEHVGAQEELSKRRDGQGQVEHITTMAAKDIEQQESADSTDKQENTTMEIDEVKPIGLVVRTKIKDNDV